VSGGADPTIALSAFDLTGFVGQIRVLLAAATSDNEGKASGRSEGMVADGRIVGDDEGRGGRRVRLLAAVELFGFSQSNRKSFESNSNDLDCCC
jgi:hypothetical protein